MKKVMFVIATVMLVGKATFAQSFSFSAVADARKEPQTWINALDEISNMNTVGSPAFSQSKFFLVCGDMDPLQYNYSEYLKKFPTLSTRPDFLMVIGNHELEDGAIHYNYAVNTIIPGISRAVLRKPNTADYYYDYENVRVIVVDGYHDLGYNGCINTDGKTWVEQTINSCPKTISHVFISFHDPAFPRHRHIGDSFDACPTERNSFWNMLISHKDLVRAVFVGHTHFYYKMKVKDPAGWEANDASKYPNEEGGIYQIDCGASGNYGDYRNTIVRVQINDNIANFRVLQADHGLGAKFSIVDEWTVEGPKPTVIANRKSKFLTYNINNFKFSQTYDIRGRLVPVEDNLEANKLPAGIYIKRNILKNSKRIVFRYTSQYSINNW